MRTAIKWGALLGAAVVVWTLVIHMLGFYTTRIAAGQRADAVAIVLPIAAIVLALRERKKHESLSFRKALTTATRSRRWRPASARPERTARSSRER